MIVAVTGASGYIGGATVRRLVSEGYRVRALVRRGSDASLCQSIAEVDIRRVDFEHVQDLAEALAGVATVIHAAGPGLVQCLQQRLCDRESVSRLLSAAKSASCRRFIYLSTVKARGPLSRPVDSALSTDIYGRRKRADETLVTQERDLDWIIVRAAAVFGPSDRKLLPLFRIATGKWVPLLNDSIVAGFGLTYIDDLTDTLALACVDGTLLMRTIEVGSSCAFTWNQLVRILARPDAKYFRLPMWLLRAVGTIDALLGRFRLTTSIVSVRLKDLTLHNWGISAANNSLPMIGEQYTVDRLRSTFDWYRRAGWLAGGIS